MISSQMEKLLLEKLQSKRMLPDKYILDSGTHDYAPAPDTFMPSPDRWKQANSVRLSYDIGTATHDPDGMIAEEVLMSVSN